MRKSKVAKYSIMVAVAAAVLAADSMIVTSFNSLP